MNSKELHEMSLAFFEKRAADKVIRSLGTVLFSALGGSYMLGTNDEESDFDVRVVSLDMERALLSGNLFGHHKFVEGEGKINSGGDMDVEIFGTMGLLEQLKIGETTAFEVLSVDRRHVFFESELGEQVFDHLKDNLDSFVSKSLVNRYLQYYKRMYHGVFPQIKRVKSGVRLERIEKFGYDSKFLMKAVWVVETLENLLDTGELRLEGDVDKLRSLRTDIREVDEVNEILADLDRRIGLIDELAESRIKRSVDESWYYDFVYDFNKRFSGVK